MKYRKLRYENSKGDVLHLNESPDSFLYDLEGMGYTYSNDIISSSYDTYRTLESTEIERSEISGVYEIGFDTLQQNYDMKIFAEKILNYDQIINRVRPEKVYGKLFYESASGLELYCYAVVSRFEFGESDDDGILSVNIAFDMISKNWISTVAKGFGISFADQAYTLGHPYGHPYGHVSTSAETGSFRVAVGGNDVAYAVIRVHGEVERPTIKIRNLETKETHKIMYITRIPAGAVLTLDFVNLSADLDGNNAISYFDLDEGDVPFFPIIPGNYKISIESTLNRGAIEVEIYESYVSA